MSQLGSLIRELLRERGMSLAELSRRSGVGRQTVRNWLSWEVLPQPPRRKTLQRIAETLGVGLPRLNVAVAQSLGADAPSGPSRPLVEVTTEELLAELGRRGVWLPGAAVRQWEGAEVQDVRPSGGPLF